MTTFAKKNRPWTKTDVKFLTEATAEGKGNTEIAVSLGRTPGSVWQKKYDLKQKRKNQRKIVPTKVLKKSVPAISRLSDFATAQSVLRSLGYELVVKSIAK